MGLIFGDSFEAGALQSSAQTAFTNHRAPKPAIVKRNANASNALQRTDNGDGPSALAAPKNVVDAALKPAMAAVRLQSLQPKATRSLASQVDCSIHGAPFVATSEVYDKARTGRVAPANVAPVRQPASSFAPAWNPITGQPASALHCGFERPLPRGGLVSLDSGARSQQRTTR